MSNDTADEPPASGGRVDADEDAVTGDTRIRVDAGEHDTYTLRREKYGLVEFESGATDEPYERYDWYTDEEFVLPTAGEAEQCAGLLAKVDAFDPNVVFFRQRDYDAAAADPEPAVDADGDADGGGE